MQEDEASLYPQSFCVPQVSELVPVSRWKRQRRVSKTSFKASLERVISSFRLIYMKLRNWLDMDDAAELVFCNRMLCGCLAEDDY